MPSIFSRIIAGEIPCHKLAETERFIAFLDINPLCEGHALAVPKLEVDYIFDLPANELADLMLFAQQVAKALQQVVPCKRIGVTVIGLEVPHAHVHLIPITANGVDDLNFTRSRARVSADTYQRIASEVQAVWEQQHNAL